MSWGKLVSGREGAVHRTFFLSLLYHMCVSCSVSLTLSFIPFIIINIFTVTQVHGQVDERLAAYTVFAPK